MRLAALFLAVAALLTAASKTLDIYIIDVGGKSSLFVSPSGQTLLIDTGVPATVDRIVDVCKAAGVKRLDYVVVSHDHPDHGLGLRFILAHFDVGCFWTSGIIEKNAKASLCGLDEIALKRKIKIRSFPDLFSDVQSGPARIRLLHPTPEFLANGPKKDLNDDSLILEISWGETRVILPGDSGRKIELSIIPALGEATMQTLLVGAHHGSRNSNSEEFLDALHPIAIVFSCGSDNQFGFPAPAAIERCAERNIPVYRTDLQGAVHAVSDGHKWTISSGQ